MSATTTFEFVLGPSAQLGVGHVERTAAVRAVETTGRSSAGSGATRGAAPQRARYGDLDRDTELACMGAASTDDLDLDSVTKPCSDGHGGLE